ncbi:hypothetical protein D3870_17640 [Noviherbaspirillum cavernae]|uniref:Uncharacterized protein n=1 Tax=Noviherbaspirillum cavernae TaxID=2320862 RepID=A0A418X530_9BURK|nr:hypothetical protein D3870_17640 [Noviherbaspirillum cavernae]
MARRGRVGRVGRAAPFPTAHALRASLVTCTDSMNNLTTSSRQRHASRRRSCDHGRGIDARSRAARGGIRAAAGEVVRRGDCARRLSGFHRGVDGEFRLEGGHADHPQRRYARGQGALAERHHGGLGRALCAPLCPGRCAGAAHHDVARRAFLRQQSRYRAS